MLKGGRYQPQEIQLSHLNCFREAEERCEKPLLQREYGNVASTVLFDGNRLSHETN